MASQSNDFEAESQDQRTGQWKSELSKRRYFLEKFFLYKTRSNFYLVGRDRSKRFWRVLKIDRSEPSELVLYEDPTEYSWLECCILLQAIHDGNIHVGGRKLVSKCYGIIGFIKFLGPYYMLIITKRRKLGEVCGHPIYRISKYRLIQIPHKSARSKEINHTDENRYKNLLRTVDLTKDFYFSYSYPLMHSLQRNLRGDDTPSMSYTSIFVWNEFLTQEIRKQVQNTLWTVALVHGFFKQVKLTRFGRKFYLTLVARRSRLNAGPRYLKRGVNEKGEAANDVEIEQIVCEEIYDGIPYKITSLVQNRGSIPLSWFQSTSWSNMNPAILLLNMDDNYEATKLHFEELTKRYGSPIVILNLVKSHGRESVLNEEYDKVITSINTTLEGEKLLDYKSLDLGELFRIEGTSVLTHLNEVAKEALEQTGFFVYEVHPPLNDPQTFNVFKYCELDSDEYDWGTSFSDVKDINNLCKRHRSAKPGVTQNGVVRTNCIDCIDRTNVAQFALGLVGLHYQLEALEIDSGDESFMYEIMEVYKDMGDAIAWQYGGSAARCKVFSMTRGEWKPATQMKEMVKTLQRYISNVYMDIKKQDAINLFLGYHGPGVDPLQMMVLDSDRSYDVEACSSHQNVASSSSTRPKEEPIYCVLCEGMTNKTLPNIKAYQIYAAAAARKNREFSVGLLASETESLASHSAVASEIDVLEERQPYASSAPELQVFTDIEEGLWFGSVGSFMSDEQIDQSDLHSTSSSSS